MLSEQASRLYDADRQMEVKVRKAVRRIEDGGQEGSAAGKVGERPDRDLLDRLIARVRRL